MALEVECCNNCPACGNPDAIWRGIGVAQSSTEYLFIDCDVCDPPPTWLRARLDRWAA
jgi:hypothetical protein